MTNNVGLKTVTVIGGGLGGLFTAAFLSKEGYRVTVLEKNKVIGGGLQTFSRHGVGFETGMHLLGGMRDGGSLNMICRYLGIYDKMDIRDTDHDCMDQITYLSDGKTYRVPEGREAFAEYFSAEFPDERQHIHAYVDALYKMVEEIDFFYLRPTNEHVYTHSEEFMWPADRFVAHYIKNPKLRDVLCYMNPMFGGVEGKTPTYIHALINVLYIEGPSRFAGNSQQMAEVLTDIIRGNGGDVIGGDKVIGIDIVDRMITAVHTKNGKKYVSDYYISDIHPQRLLAMTDSKVFSKAFRDRIAEAPNSYSSFCAYFIFKPRSFPFINHTCYFQEDYGRVWNYGEYASADWPRGFMYMTPSEKNQDEYAVKMVVNAIMPYSAVKPWIDTDTGCRGKDYDEWKQLHIKKIIDRMEVLYPGFMDKVDYMFASSPLTIRDYYDEPDGALYGLFRDCDNIAQSQVSVFTKVRNLFMTGQNVNLHGFCGVPLTAITTAEAIVGHNVILNKINEYNARV
jgi:all-trans-retinol 13,14-reductase